MKPDRLGRSMIDTAQLAQSFRDTAVGFWSLTDSVDTSTVSVRMLFSLLATCAEWECEFIVECTVAGLQHARVEGHVDGRRPVMQRPLALLVKAPVGGGLSPVGVAKQLKLGRATAYRYVKSYGEAL